MAETTKDVKPTKKMNYAVEFWRFVSCMIFILVHVYIVYPTVYWQELPWIKMMGNKPHVMFKGSLDVIIIFYLITGYFLMKTHVKNKNARSEKEKVTASGEAGKYLLKRIKTFYPAFLICLFIGLVLTNLYNEIPVAQWLKVAVDSLWEWGGCVVSGLGIGNNVYGLMPESHMLMNGPLWFISCLLVVGYIIYFLLEKCEDWFIGILAPIGFIFVYGYFHLNGISGMWYTFIGQSSFSTAFLQALVCIGMGCVFYVWVDKLKDYVFSNGTKIFLTIANVAASAIVIYHMIWGTEFTFVTINGLCMIIVFLVLLNQDYFTKLLDTPIWKYPGKLALYIYMLHYPIIGFLHKFVGIKSLHATCFATYGITIVLSLCLMIIVDNVITPALTKKDKKASK